MHFVGIDLSINYPAFCVSEDFETFEFFGFVNDPRISNSNLQYVLSETAKYDGVTVSHIAYDRKGADAYHVEERNKLLNFDHIVSQMLIEIRKRVANDRVILAMEGISYGSKGSALVDICMLTGMFRRAVLKEILNGEASRMFVFSPSELKNAIGIKGNGTKTEVLAQFLDDPGIAGILESGMWKFMYDHIPHSEDNNLLASEYVYNTNKDKVGSPFNDMIDAYLSVLKIYKSSGAGGSAEPDEK